MVQRDGQFKVIRGNQTIMNAYTEGNKLIQQRMELSAQIDKLGGIQKVSERYQRQENQQQVQRDRALQAPR